MKRQFCLYDELRSRIKSLLLSQRKADPVCHISMSFDTIYFDGLIRRSKNPSNPPMLKEGSVHSAYVVQTGRHLWVQMVHKKHKWSWFLFYRTGHSRVSLKVKQSWFPDATDGKLSKIVFEEGCQLIFQFVRGDGTCSEWSHVLKSCQTPSVEWIQLVYIHAYDCMLMLSWYNNNYNYYYKNSKCCTLDVHNNVITPLHTLKMWL